MLSLTRKTDYALLALARLAQQRADEGGSLSARQLADRDGLPLPRLTNLLKDLQRAGLVTSTRGVRGGYALAVDPQQVTLGQVLAAIEGPVQMAMCCGPQHEVRCTRCGIEEACPITVSIHRVNERINGYLHQITLAQLLAPGGYRPSAEQAPAAPVRGMASHSLAPTR